MTLNSAMNSIRPDSATNAAKIPAWGGYVFKTVPEGAQEGHYQLRYVQRNGDQYVFDVNGATSVATYLGFVEHGTGGSLGTGTPVAPVASTTLVYDAALVMADYGAEWTTGNNADFEAARSGGGVW